jgi:hypothetical protein
MNQVAAMMIQAVTMMIAMTRRLRLRKPKRRKMIHLAPHPPILIQIQAPPIRRRIVINLMPTICLTKLKGMICQSNINS